MWEWVCVCAQVCACVCTRVLCRPSGLGLSAGQVLIEPNHHSLSQKALASWLQQPPDLRMTGSHPVACTLRALPSLHAPAREATWPPLHHHPLIAPEAWSLPPSLPPRAPEDDAQGHAFLWGILSDITALYLHMICLTQLLCAFPSPASMLGVSRPVSCLCTCPVCVLSTRPVSFLCTSVLVLLFQPVL